MLMTTPHKPDMFETLEQTTRLVEENNPDEAYRVMKEAVAEDSQGFARMFLSQWMKHMENAQESIKNKFSEILAFLKEDYPEPAPEPEEPTQVQTPPSSRASAMPVWLAPLDKPKVQTQQKEPEKREPEPENVQPVVEAPSPAVEPEPATQPTEAETVQAEVVEAPEVQPKVEPEPEAAAQTVPTQEEETKAEEPEPEVTETAKVVVPETPAPEPVAETEPEPAPEPKSKVIVELEQEELESLTLTFYEWQMTAIAKAAMREKVDENALLKQMLETRNLEPLMWSRYRKGTPSPTKRITIAVPHEIKATIEEDKHAEGMKTTTRYVRKVLFGKRAEKA
jgi:hypothetical protein